MTKRLPYLRETICTHHFSQGKSCCQLLETMESSDRWCKSYLVRDARRVLNPFTLLSGDVTQVAIKSIINISWGEHNYWRISNPFWTVTTFVVDFCRHYLYKCLERHKRRMTTARSGPSKSLEVSVGIKQSFHWKASLFFLTFLFCLHLEIVLKFRSGSRSSMLVLSTIRLVVGRDNSSINLSNTICHQDIKTYFLCFTQKSSAFCLASGHFCKRKWFVKHEN